MSAYGHEMERGYSARSLSSREGSVGSHYMVESGFFITSFAATIFIGGLIIVGVLLITLLIALTIMLQSCESKSAGAVEISGDDYNYCKIYAMHAELNSLGVDDFPSICKDLTIPYIKEGQYLRDLNFSTLLAEDYFNSFMPLDDGLDVVLMDIDDLLPSNFHYNNQLLHQFSKFDCDDCVEKAKILRCTTILRLYVKLQASGWPLILLSRKPEKHRNATIEHLLSAGFGGWSSLIMRLDDEIQMNSSQYFSRRRAIMQEEGFRIAGTISSQMDALTGPCLGKRIFKLPNPIFYYNSEHHFIESTNQQR
ncbi:uncharacterized protein At2g39920 isoform X2 [Malania oleifera]|uniref:uncharacterized protein At2g39920 isoform X2 n=1 Tax=Malania oleifera TaxID=397392 RepID=UPI0025AE43D6|nr:uncharacterized protein At2g39920 isoform X2 [Malania oleifera]